jgi:Usg-like family
VDIHEHSAMWILSPICSNYLPAARKAPAKNVRFPSPTYDLWPAFPELQQFLNFLRESLEGDLHSVIVAHSNMIKPAELRAVDGVFRLH